MKQRQIHNFNKTTFIIYTSIMCWLFPQSLQYRLKALVKRFFLYCLMFQLMHLWNEIPYDWSFNSQKAFLDTSSDVHQNTPQEKQKLHISTFWTVQLQTHFPLAGSWATKKEYKWFSQSSNANSSVNTRCNIIQSITGDGLYFKELIRIYWRKNTEENYNDF